MSRREPPARGPVVVYGAGGHTGRFVVGELVRRAIPTIVAGRDPARLGASGLLVRSADVDDPDALDRMLRGCRAVINCAGPFLATAHALVEAALRAGIHYLDISAEQASTRAVFDQVGARAAIAGVSVVPAMAFYGGLADLLATEVMGGWAEADEIVVAVGLDSWHPTEGTRRTGQLNTAPRVVVIDGQLAPLPATAPISAWRFPPPLGGQAVAAVPLAEIITIARHLRARAVHSYMNLAPLAELRDAATPGPVPVDASGRSAQRFVLEVVARRDGVERRAHVAGRDIYAVTAPLVVEALARILDGRVTRRGVGAPGEVFAAAGFLRALPVERG